MLFAPPGLVAVAPHPPDGHQLRPQISRLDKYVYLNRELLLFLGRRGQREQLSTILLQVSVVVIRFASKLFLKTVPRILFRRNMKLSVVPRYFLEINVGVYYLRSILSSKLFAGVILELKHGY